MSHQSASSTSIDDCKVVIEQTLLKMDEVFVYRIPPCLTSGGHRADDWNLAKPQATCSIIVLRRDSALLIRLFSEQSKEGGPPGATEKVLFAQCRINLEVDDAQSSSSAKQNPHRSKPSIDYWVEPVTDSSRYFVMRISDEKTGREAHVGMGFRERNDALSFKMSLQEYENMMRKEAKVKSMSDSANVNCRTNEEVSHADDISQSESTDISTSSISTISKLSLKEGEKIHINIKGTASAKARPKKGQQDGGNLKPPILLRKPPSSLSMVSNSSVGQAVVFNSDVIRSNRSGTAVNDSSSVIALAETIDTEDDEWGEFESVPSVGITED